MIYCLHICLFLMLSDFYNKLFSILTKRSYCKFSSFLFETKENDKGQYYFNKNPWKVQDTVFRYRNISSLLLVIFLLKITMPNEIKTFSAS